MSPPLELTRNFSLAARLALSGDIKPMMVVVWFANGTIDILVMVVFRVLPTSRQSLYGLRFLGVPT